MSETVVTINEKDPAKLLEILNSLDPEEHLLKFENAPDGILGKSFEYEGQTFIVTGIGIEDGEEPLLEAMRSDLLQFENGLDEYGNKRPTNAVGYYTKDEHPNKNFQSEFRSHTDWQFTAGNRYAWNIPNVSNGTLIGFYWLPLTTVLGSWCD